VPDKRPPAYTEGLGELIRAHRNYIGLSPRSMALKIGMGEKSFVDIENGRRACPPGLLDSVVHVVATFDRDVQKAVEVAESAQATENEPFEMPVNNDPRLEWQRAVIGRAAVDSGLILPILVGDRQPPRS